jgi:hypothetical protein
LLSTRLINNDLAVDKEGVNEEHLETYLKYKEYIYNNMKSDCEKLEEKVLV